MKTNLEERKHSLQRGRKTWLKLERAVDRDKGDWLFEDVYHDREDIQSTRKCPLGERER